MNNPTQQPPLNVKTVAEEVEKRIVVLETSASLAVEALRSIQKFASQAKGSESLEDYTYAIDDILGQCGVLTKPLTLDALTAIRHRAVLEFMQWLSVNIERRIKNHPEIYGWGQDVRIGLSDIKEIALSTLNGREEPQPTAATQYDPEFGDSRECADPECGHRYYRHFDTYGDMAPVGCKHCSCPKFKIN